MKRIVLLIVVAGIAILGLGAVLRKGAARPVPAPSPVAPPSPAAPAVQQALRAC